MLKFIKKVLYVLKQILNKYRNIYVEVRGQEWNLTSSFVPVEFNKISWNLKFVSCFFVVNPYERELCSTIV